jgi:hypothetical protein
MVPFQKTTEVDVVATSEGKSGYPDDISSKKRVDP